MQSGTMLGTVSYAERSVKLQLTQSLSTQFHKQESVCSLWYATPAGRGI